MSALLKSICDYQSLLGRRDRLHRPLDESSSRRLHDLEELLAAQPGEEAPAPEGSARRRHARVDVAFSATVEVQDRIAPVVIGNISGGGVCVRRAKGLEPGARTVVTVSDARNRRAYLFPAEVAWTDGGLAGLAFVGIAREFVMPVAVRTGTA